MGSEPTRGMERQRSVSAKQKEDFTNLSGERKQALLLHCLGGEGQEVLENLPPLSQADQRGLNEYEICARQLDLHYLPKISTIMERYHFGLREQGKEESVEEYITALRKLASSCKFGVTELDYLGHHISRRGVSPKKDLVDTIEMLKEPCTKDEVSSFLVSCYDLDKSCGRVSSTIREHRLLKASYILITAAHLRVCEVPSRLVTPSCASSQSYAFLNVAQ
ncbi:hypothetical protein NDU88_000488 [Pleurodeles waltl]|uniref:Retrotransposon gag domain-containing protein n=1 Tax=Pleurodeles waltl TaxID=8319 RepID=A0AAV7MJV0_PLEWA|nr:hypothetical protein NDU88_000488 [Pleurodeles waltl]